MRLSDITTGDPHVMWKRGLPITNRYPWFDRPQDWTTIEPVEIARTPGANVRTVRAIVLVPADGTSLTAGQEIIVQGTAVAMTAPELAVRALVERRGCVGLHPELEALAVQTQELRALWQPEGPFEATSEIAYGHAGLRTVTRITLSGATVQAVNALRVIRTRMEALRPSAIPPGALTTVAYNIGWSGALVGPQYNIGQPQLSAPPDALRAAILAARASMGSTCA